MSKIIIVPNSIKNYCIKTNQDFYKRFLSVDDAYDYLFGNVKLTNNFIEKYPFNIYTQMHQLARIIKNDTYQQSLLQDILTIKQSQKYYQLSKGEFSFVNIYDKYITKHYQTHIHHLSLNNTINYYQYPSIKDEIIACLEQIADLIKQGVNINDINIIYGDNTYEYQLMFYSLFYDFELEKVSFPTLNIISDFQTFIKDFFNVDLYDNLNNISDNLVKEKVIHLLNQCNDFTKEQQYYYLTEKSKLTTICYETIIDVVNVYSYKQAQINKYNFFIGMHDLSDIYNKKNYVLSDFECDLIDINNANDIVNNDQLLLALYTNLENTFFSMSYTNGKETFNPLPDLHIIKKDKVIIRYSEALATFLCAYHDVEYLDEKLKITPYHHQFNSFNINNSIKQISFSSLNVLRKCPFKFYLEKIVKLNTPINVNIIIGSIIHDCIYDYHLQPTITYQEYETYITKAMIKYHDYPFDQLDLIYAKQTLLNYYDSVSIIISDIYNSKAKGYEVKQEHEIKMLWEDISLIGKIDLLLIKDQLFNIIDFKVKKIKITQQKLINDSLNDVVLQNLIYTYILLNNNYGKVNSIIQLGFINDTIYKNEDIEKKFRNLYGWSIGGIVNQLVFDKDYQAFDDSIKAVKHYLNVAYNYIKTNNYEIKPLNKEQKICNYCPFHHICHANIKDYRYKEIYE